MKHTQKTHWKKHISDNSKHSNTDIIRVLKEGGRKTSEDITAENFPNFMKTINLQIQEGQQIQVE